MHIQYNNTYWLDVSKYLVDWEKKKQMVVFDFDQLNRVYWARGKTIYFATDYLLNTRRKNFAKTLHKNELTTKRSGAFEPPKLS